MNTMKALKKQLGEEVKEGRPKGSGTAEQTVREWQESHPAGKKADCIRETGLRKSDSPSQRSAEHRCRTRGVDGRSQKTRLGAILNETGDVISDIALYLPFLFLPESNATNVNFLFPESSVKS